MRVKIIGSAAGGAFPQWNCNYHLSQSARAGVPGINSRTQSSIIASADGKGWVLFNASPDILRQIAETPELHPAKDGPLRSTPIRAVILTNADIDHIAGLLSLREREPFAIYATEQVLQTLENNSVFNVLARDVVPRRQLKLGQEEICDAQGNPTGIIVDSFAVPGKVALFLENTSDPKADFSSDSGDTIGVAIKSKGSPESVFYIPGCARIDEKLRDRLRDAACLLFDGTVYTDDEMLTAGVGQKTGTRMGHLPISGDEGAIAALADLGIDQRIFVHINNTNPVLDDHSSERKAVEAAGWKVAHDGMELVL